jgi:hypothetical protein
MQFVSKESDAGGCSVLSLFREFVSALEGKAVKITDTNLTGLSRLCEECGFSEVGPKPSEFCPSMGFQEAEDADARRRIAALEDKAERHDCAIAVLQDKFTALSTDFVCLAGEVTALRSASAGMQSLSGEVSTLKTQIVQRLSMKFDKLRREVSLLKTQIPAMPAAAAPSVPNRPPPSVLDSRVISDFPKIVAEFRRKRFEILCRDGRDGFKVAEFHRRCDGHANTLTVILDTEGNIFGGFTPVEWDKWLEKQKTHRSNRRKDFLTWSSTTPGFSHNI